MISTPEPLKNDHSAHTANMVAQSQQNDLQVDPQGNPESIKNRQKSKSELQGVRLGVPSDPGSANWHQNDSPRPPKMETPGLQNARIGLPKCQSTPTAQNILGFAAAKRASRQTAHDFLGFVRPMSVKTRCELRGLWFRSRQHRTF